MKTITATVTAYATEYSAFRPEQIGVLPATNLIDTLSFYETDMSGVDGWVRVGSAKITIEFDSLESLTANQISALEEQKRRIQAEAGAKVTEIEGRIQSLLALPAPAGDEPDDENTASDAEIADALAGYESRNDGDLPQHKRADYLEQMYDAADSRRKAQREDAL